MTRATTFPDGRVRRRVTTIVGGPSGVSAVGSYSASSEDISWCDRHYVAVVCYGVPSGGVVSVRGVPRNTPPSTTVGLKPIAIPIGIEGIVVTAKTSRIFTVSGFFDSFELDVTTAISGGIPVSRVVCVVNSFPSLFGGA